MKPGDKIHYIPHNREYIIDRPHPHLKKWWYVYGHPLALIETQMWVVAEKSEEALNQISLETLSFPIITWNKWLGVVENAVKEKVQNDFEKHWDILWVLIWSSHFSEENFNKVLGELSFELDISLDDLFWKQYVVKSNFGYCWFVSGINACCFWPDGK